MLWNIPFGLASWRTKRIKIIPYYSTIFRKQSRPQNNSGLCGLQKDSFITPLAWTPFTCVAAWEELFIDWILFFTYEWDQVPPCEHKHEVLIGADVTFLPCLFSLTYRKWHIFYSVAWLAPLNSLRKTRSFLCRKIIFPQWLNRVKHDTSLIPTHGVRSTVNWLHKSKMFCT